MLLALSSWIYPTPVQAKIKASLPEANIEIKQEVKEPYGPIPISQKENKKAVTKRSRNTVGISNLIQRNTSTSENSGRHYSKEEVQALIISYSHQYGVNPEVPLCIARLESGFNQFSKNKSSSASGVFQYLSGTWRATDEGKSGLSVFDAEANIKAAIKYIASRKSTQPWSVRSKCPNL